MEAGLFGHVDGLFQEFQKKRIEDIVGFPGCHRVEMYRQTDDVGAEAFDVPEILYCVAGELDSARGRSLEPACKINTPGEGHVGCRESGAEEG
ncbi:MAG: hypothetical protein MZV64_09685 [Ignavibacteriales bacterium]|nr:hypothetical protein [Ignavibacteriales bacterium]